MVPFIMFLTWILPSDEGIGENLIRMVGRHTHTHKHTHTHTRTYTQHTPEKNEDGYEIK
jgi:hypothetical protein